METISVGRDNLVHALRGYQWPCTDPDCEIHYPEVIEDEDERLTAFAWFLIGYMRGVGNFADTHEDVVQDFRIDLMDEINFRGWTTGGKEKEVS